MNKNPSPKPHVSGNVKTDWRSFITSSKAPTARALIGVMFAAPFVFAAAPAARAATTQEELLRLLKEQSAELKKLKQEVENLKRQRTAPQASAPVPSGARQATHAAQRNDGFVSKSEGQDSLVGTLLDRFVEKGTRPKSWRLPGTDVDISIGGFAKVDFISRLRGETSGAEDLFITNAIIPDGFGRGTDARSRFHARESRLNVVLTKQTDLGLFRAQVEGDFFGAAGNQLVSNSDSFRLRHAYGELGPLLFGQFWGTFSDPSVIAETLDFQGSSGYTFIRQAQVRYTHTIDKGVTLAFAVENPEVRVVVNNVVATGSPASAFNTTQVQTRDNNIPDFVVRGRYEDSWGSLQLGVLLRSISGENFSNIAAGSATNPVLNIGAGSGRGTGFGVAGSVHAKFNLPGSGAINKTDFVGLQFLYGSGVGRYIQDTAGASGEAAINPVTGRLEVLTSYGGYFTYKHYWADDWRSNVTFSAVRVNTPGYLNANAYRGAYYLAGNLIWTPVTDLDLGVEIQWGQRENRDGRIGDALRLQTSAKFSF